MINDLPDLFNEILELENIYENLEKKNNFVKDLSFTYVFNQGEIVYEYLLKNKIYSQEFLNKYGRVNQNFAKLKTLIVPQSGFKKVNNFDLTAYKEEEVVTGKKFKLPSIVTNEANNVLKNIINKKIVFSNPITQIVYGNYFDYVVAISYLYAALYDSEMLCDNHVHKAYKLIKRIIRSFDNLFNSNNKLDNKLDKFMENLTKNLINNEYIYEDLFKDRMKHYFGVRFVSKVLLLLRNMELINYYIDKKTNKVVISINKDNFTGLDSLKNEISTLLVQ